MKKIVLFLTLVTSGLSFAQDLPSMSGGGNFTNGNFGVQTKQQLKILKDYYGVGKARINLYPNYYYNKQQAKATPASIDSVMILFYESGIEPILLFEYYGSYNDLGTKQKWETIGREFAKKWAPNSAHLISKGIKNWGIKHYTLINEPDLDQSIPKTSADNALSNYHDVIEGFADGVHSVSKDLKVIPGGFASENAWSIHDLKGYLPAIADLVNNGKVAGIDLHTYNDDRFAPIIKATNGWTTYVFSAQSDFNEVKKASGIKSDVGFYSTEYSYKANTQTITEDAAAKFLFMTIFNNLGIVGNDGKTLKTNYALAWNLFNTTTSDPTYGFCYQLDPYLPTPKALTFKLAMDLTRGLEYTSLDSAKGIYVLANKTENAWVYHNTPTWTNLLSATDLKNGYSSFSIPNVPIKHSMINCCNYKGLVQTKANTNGTVVFDNLPINQTYIFKNAPLATDITNEFESQAEEMAFTVFPNPFISATTVFLKAGIKKIQLFDASGVLVDQEYTADTTYILGDQLKSGLYFLKINERVIRLIKN